MDRNIGRYCHLDETVSAEVHCDGAMPSIKDGCGGTSKRRREWTVSRTDYLTSSTG